MYFFLSKVKARLMLLTKIISIQSNVFHYWFVCCFLFYEKISQHIPYSFFQQRKQSFVLLALLAKLNKKLMASTNGLNIFFFYTQRYLSQSWSILKPFLKLVYSILKHAKKSGMQSPHLFTSSSIDTFEYFTLYYFKHSTRCVFSKKSNKWSTSLLHFTVSLREL